MLLILLIRINLFLSSQAPHWLCMWVLRISSQVLGLTQRVLLAAELLPKTKPAVIYKNQQKALLRHYYCDLKGWHVFSVVF